MHPHRSLTQHVSIPVALPVIFAFALPSNAATRTNPEPRNRASSDEAPTQADDGWVAVAPSAVGLDSDRLDALHDTIVENPDWNLHAVLVANGEQIAFERFYRGHDENWGRALGVVEHDRERLHDLRSITKSVTSALLGIAIGQGKVPGVQTPLPELFPRAAAIVRDEHGAITLEHLLSMSAGFDWNESMPYDDPRNTAIQMIRSPDALRFVLGRPVVETPGTTFRYCGGCTALIAEAIERRTGEDLDRYAERTLFQPLGIQEYEWHRHSSGDLSASSGLRLRPRDLLKIGALYLNEGRWAEREVVPAEWVSATFETRVQPNWTIGYGYQWFLEDYRADEQVLRVLTGAGNGGQKLFVIPDLNLVVLFLAGNYNNFDVEVLGRPERLLAQFVLPASGIEGAALVRPPRFRRPDRTPPP